MCVLSSCFLGMLLEIVMINKPKMFLYNHYMKTDRYDTHGATEAALEELANTLQYSMEDILRAVQEVGYDRDDVEEYIRDRENRS